MTRKDEQQENIERVSDRIGRLIVRFCEQLPGDDFRMDDLLRFVRKHDPMVAPDSPGRILRDLRQKGTVRYVVLSRKNSHYRLVGRAA